MATAVSAALNPHLASALDNPVQPEVDQPERQAISQESEYEHSAAAALLGLYASCMASSDSDARTSHSSATSEDSDPLPMFLSIDWDTGNTSPGSSAPSPKVARPRNGKDGAPPPGTCRFQCRYPNCNKLYASTDAVRKHCRKRHFDWLRRLDQLATHERQMPKPALYCRWGGAETA